MTLPKYKFKSILALVFIASAFLTSCKDNEKVQDIETNTPQEATLEQKKQALENFAPNSNKTNTSGDLAINPAHGQPGHRCDIPVGAPLQGNNSPIKMEMNKNNAGPAVNSTAGLNPPHGKPGHRCDIKVGDPL